MSRRTDFEAERKRQLRELLAADAATQDDVKRLLTAAQGEIARKLASQPSAYQLWRLGDLASFVGALAKELGSDLGQAVRSGAQTSQAAGMALVDEPLKAAGLRLGGQIGEVATEQLAAIRAFLTHKMEGISSNLAGRINDRLGLVVIGAEPPFEAMRGINDLITGGMQRAETVVRTEIGRVYSVATHGRQQEVKAVVPDLKRVWQASGRLHARASHALLDGQIVDVETPWTLINGTRIMFPRDPAAPAGETINCGCMALPHMERWD